MRRIIYLIIFSLLFPCKLHAQGVSVLNGVEHFSLPAPGKMISQTPTYMPVLVKGVKIYPAEPFRFDFIIDKGQTTLEAKAFEEESKKLVKYFLASLTIPEDDLWVNLSPYQKKKIIAKGFGQTEMGRDLLAQDYILKQLSASLLYPEKELGKKFWDSVYQQVKAKYGEIEIPVKTFNKVWIVPEDPIVYQNGDYAYVVSSKLKVMLEQDYLALQNNQSPKPAAEDSTSQQSKNEVSQLMSAIIREIILTAIEKEVNEGKNFAQLRQIQNSLVLAVWYKKTLQQSLLSSIYADKNKTLGIDLEDKKISEKIYQQYLEAFKKGVYDYVKEEYDSVAQETIPKKYFSGGYSTTTEKGNLAKRTRVVSSVAQVPESERQGFENYIQEVERGASAAVSVAVKLSSVGSSGIKQQYNLALNAWQGFTAKADEQLRGDMKDTDALVKRLEELEQEISKQASLIKTKDGELKQTKQDLRDLETLPITLPIYKRILLSNRGKKEAFILKVKGLYNELDDLRKSQKKMEAEVTDLRNKYSERLRAALERGFNRFKDLREALVSDEGLYADFNESLIEKHILPNLQRLQSQGKMSAELAEEYLNLIREDLKEGRQAFYSWGEETTEARERVERRIARLREIHDQVRDLDLIALSLQSDRISSKDAYSGLIELIIRNEKARWAQSVVDHITKQELSSDLQFEARKTTVTFFSQEWDRKEEVPSFDDVTSAVKRIDEKTLRKDFLSDEVKMRWETVRGHSLIMAVFGTEAFDRLERDLADFTVDRLLVSKQHTDSAINLGYRLFWLVEQNPGLRVELAPFLIMNSWREPGYSGERPFISVYSASDKTKLYEFVASLTDAEIAVLRARNIPGLIQVIDAVLGYPENFTTPRIVDPDWTRFVKAFEQKGFKQYGRGRALLVSVQDVPSLYQSENSNFFDDVSQKFLNVKDEVDKILASLGLQADVLISKDQLVPNPAYQAILQGLVQLSLALMQEENEAKQFFVMGLLSQIPDVDFGEGYKLSKNILIYSKNTKLQDELLKMVVTKALYGGASQANFKAVEMLLESYASVSGDIQEKIREKGPELFNSFWQASDLTNEHIRLLARVLGKDEQSVKALINFLKEVLPYQTLGYGEFYRPEKFNDYMGLAQQQGVVEMIRQLADYGYRFSVDHADALEEMVSQKDKIIEGIKAIKELFPSYQYTLLHGRIITDTVTRRHEWGYISNPYQILFDDWVSIVRILETLYTQHGSFSREFSDGLLVSLRDREDIASLKEPDEATYKQFYASLQTFLRESFAPEGKIREYTEFYLNVDVFRYIARNPQSISEILSFPETVPQLFVLLKEGGALYANQSFVAHDIFANGNALARATEIITVFTQKVEYWQQLFLFTELRLGSQLDSSTSEYPIVELDTVSIKEVVSKEPTGTVISDPAVAQELIAGQLQSVPFNALTPKYKRLVYRDYLRKTIVLSQSDKAKQQADQRNRLKVAERLVFEDGDYIHGSPVDVIDQVLLYGNLPYESLGASAKADSYPFHVDFTRLADHYMEDKKGDITKIIDESLSSSYGTKGKFYGDGQLWYVYKRSPVSWEHGINYGPSDYHALILGGMPATEISAIVLRNPKSTLETAKRAVLENGFYIPIYDLNGQLLFSYREYDSIRDDLNLSVPVTTWDFSMKTGEQKGSNPGAEFTVPEEAGSEKNYVKFGPADELDHIWVETLADSIYRVLGLDVPETKIVKVDGSYGHASKILPLDGFAVDPNTGRQLKDGFLADSLLANWDIPYAYRRNTALSNNKVYRLDNGGALIFRARGQKKSLEQFGPESPVRELERGADQERLGFGMRQVYEEFGLTDDDVLTQAIAMRDRLPDSVIDQLVDGVRLSRDTRAFLKVTLKHRRDYILKKFGVEVLNSQLENAGELKASSSLDGEENKIKKDNLGGIDLNPALYRLRIKRDDHGVPLPMLQQPADVQDINIDGLFPVIINIMPVKSLPGVLLSSNLK